MVNEFLAISDGTFTLSETEVKDQFYFYRNDGGVLEDIDDEPMDLYEAYISHKMQEGEITDIVMNDICFERSNDNKCIRMTTYPMGKRPKIYGGSKVNAKPFNSLRQLIRKIFC